ncbi:MAG TPA: response regulator [Cyclobacteriaceae bacterium]|nr:response regulator [Cyclobacteriaceae bacterium]
MENLVEILLVEDNQEDAELTIRALRKHKLENKLIHLMNGEEALDFLFAEGKYAGRKLEDGPKVILLDLKMPKVSGIEVLERIKSDERTKMIPVVVLTSSKEDPDIKTCYALVANSYVVKPVSLPNFHRLLLKLDCIGYCLIIRR